MQPRPTSNPSSLSFGKVILFLLLNVLVSAATTWVVIRVLLPPLPASMAEASGASPTAYANPTVVATMQVEATQISETNTPLPAIIVSATSIPTLPPQPSAKTPTTNLASKIRIQSVIYSGQATRETVVLLNEGEPIDLTGWQLVSPRGEGYTFGRVTLFKDSYLNIHSTTGADVPTDLYWNLDKAVWAAGDLVQLKRNGEVVASFTVKP